MVASMSVSRLAISLASLLLVLPTQPSSAMDSDSASTQSEAAGPSPARAIGHLPLAFEENFGQAGSDTRFLARSPNYTVLLGDTQATVVFQEASQRSRIGRAIQSSRAVMGSLLLNLIGATRSGDATGENVLAARSNYFIGNDPALWHTNIPTYSRVRYSSIYKGIDLVYYGNDGNLEYDFILHPGSDSETIRFGLDHSTSVQLQANGDLLVRVGDAKLQLRKPVAYQIIRGQKTKIESHFRMLGKGQYGLRIGHYDARYDLIVDPVLTYSTYLGGKDDEGIFGIAFDNDRNLYVAGETSSVNFPTKNPIQSQVGGSYDAFVSKFDPTGKKLIYSTYLGGNDYDHAVGLRVDRQGRAYLAGITFSADFPVQNALQTTKGGPADGFVAKLGQSGSELIFSTFLGGNGFDEVNAITLGQDDSIYVTGFTNSSDFPTTPNAMSTKCDGGVQPFCIGDAFVAKLDLVGQTLLYSTYVGGSSYDSANGIAVDARPTAQGTSNRHLRKGKLPGSGRQNIAGRPSRGGYLSHLKVEAELRSHGPRCHIVRAAEGGQEVIQRVLVGQVNDSNLRAPLIPLTAKQVVIPYREIKQMPWSDARRIFVVVLGVRPGYLQQGRSELRGWTGVGGDGVSGGCTVGSTK
jgi:hypothetical protein